MRRLLPVVRLAQRLHFGQRGTLLPAESGLRTRARALDGFITENLMEDALEEMGAVAKGEAEVAPPPDPSKSALRAALLGSTTDDIMGRLAALHRQTISEGERAVAGTLLEELADRADALTVSGFRDALNVGFTSENFAQCLELFHRRRRTPAARDVRFTVYDILVDCAFRLRSPRELETLAAACAELVSARPREIIADFSLCRCFWRAVCIEQDRTIPASVRTEAAAALETIWGLIVSTNPAAADAALDAQAATTIARRCVLYAPEGDRGEMSFHQWCVEARVLRAAALSEREFAGSEAYFSGLIRTCRAGKFASVAMDYFNRYREVVAATASRPAASASDPPGGSQQQPEATVDAEAPWRSDDASLFDAEALSSVDALDQRGDAATTIGGVPDGSGRPTSDAAPGVIAEAVLYSLLSLLVNAKRFAMAVELGHQCAGLKTAPTGQPLSAQSFSPNIWSTLCVAAGEAKDFDFALLCYEKVMSDVKGMHITRSVSFNVYSCLSAISKCYAPDFNERFLQPCVSMGYLRRDDGETRACLLLQNALGSPDPMGVAGPLVEEALQGAPSSTDVISMRVASLLFKILLRCESPLMLRFYRHMVERRRTHKQLWTEELVLWADRRRYFLSQEDAAYILGEVRRVFRIADIKSANLGGVEKLRTHVAALLHDEQHQPRERFLQEGWVSPEPTVMDSRAHFLVKKRCCIEGAPRAAIGAFLAGNRGMLNWPEAEVDAQLSPGAVSDAEARVYLMNLAYDSVGAI